jgi:hypothetical protein
MAMTPLGVRMALHYWTSPGPYASNEPSHANSSAVREMKDFMLKSGLLKFSPAGAGRDYDAGPALETYVEALCNVQLPEQQWIIPKREE